MASLMADSVISSDGELKDVSVTGIDDSSVSLSDGRKLELDNLSALLVYEDLRTSACAVCHSAWEVAVYDANVMDETHFL